MADQKVASRNIIFEASLILARAIRRRNPSIVGIVCHVNIEVVKIRVAGACEVLLPRNLPLDCLRARFRAACAVLSIWLGAVWNPARSLDRVERKHSYTHTHAHTHTHPKVLICAHAHGNPSTVLIPMGRLSEIETALVPNFQHASNIACSKLKRPKNSKLNKRHWPPACACVKLDRETSVWPHTLQAAQLLPALPQLLEWSVQLVTVTPARRELVVSISRAWLCTHACAIDSRSLQKHYGS